MATSLSTASLKVTIEEKITLNGVKRGSKVVKTISGIKEVYQRIVEVPTAGAEIVAIAAAKGADGFSTLTKYIRITNKDLTNFVTLNFYDNADPNSANDLFSIKLEAGKSFILGSTLFDASVSDADGLLTANQQIAKIKAQADTAACDIEIFIGE
jgi:hypothetical protein